jgi:hypothetical protein
MYSFAIGSLPLITNGLANYGFILQSPIEGLDAPNYRNTYFSNPGRDGGTVSSQFYDARMITLTGKLHGDNPTMFEARRKQLAAACAIQKDTNGYPVPIRLTFTTLAGSNYFIDVYFDRPVFDYEETPNHCRFMVTATAAIPYVFGTTQITSSPIMPPSGGGYPVPMSIPLVIAASVGGSVTLNNPGSVNVYPIITETGTLTNPIIYNQTTGKYLKLNTTIGSGQVVQIDMYKQLITLNSSSSLIGAKSSDSDWWTVVPGSNTFRLETGNTADTGNAVISFYPAYTGV